MPMQHTALKPINLALQGGGAHGAYTWGVLDALLEDGRLEFEGVSGTSAGAMNTVICAEGMRTGGAAGARAALEAFWRDVSGHSSFNGGASPFNAFLSSASPFGFNMDNSPAFMWMNMMSNMFSPYDYNPMNINPLQDVLVKHVDFAALKANPPFHMFISATNVHTGKAKVFDNNEISAEAVMASACLPLIFQAVEIDGVPYWDGGYMGNPVLFPFFYNTKCEDILLVQVNPVVRAETPKTAASIMNRLNEITFNASLLREFRAIDFVAKLIDQGVLSHEHYQQVRMHRIDSTEEFKDLDASSKLNPEWSFLQILKNMGRNDAINWLALNYEAVGHHATMDVRAELG